MLDETILQCVEKPADRRASSFWGRRLAAFCCQWRLAMTAPTKMASTFCTVRIENIGIPLRKRDVDPGNVERLAESIASVGLLNPLVVRRTGASQSGILTLVAGRHRLEALKRL